MIIVSTLAVLHSVGGARLLKLVLHHLVEQFFVSLSVCELIARACFRVLVSVCGGFTILILHLILLLNIVVTSLNLWKVMLLLLIILLQRPTLLHPLRMIVSLRGHRLESHDSGLCFTAVRKMRRRLQMLQLLQARVLLLSVGVLLFAILGHLVAFFEARDTLHQFFETVMILSLVLKNVF